MPTRKRKPRRRWGNWELFSGNPPSLGYRIGGKGNAYQVPLAQCQTQEGYNKWIRQISMKVGWDVDNFKRAIEELRAEGKYLKHQP